MSYVFGATLALAGIADQQAQEYGGTHPKMCTVCRAVVEARFDIWVRAALAIQREEIHVLWRTPMPMPQGQVIIARHSELGRS